MATKTTKTKTSTKQVKDDVLKKPKSAKGAVPIKKQPLPPPVDDDEIENEFVEFDNINDELNDEEEWDKEFETYQATSKKGKPKKNDDNDLDFDDNFDDFDLESGSDNFNDFDDFDSRRDY
ncbi:MAG: hypothetical protein QM539_06855 [Alphaproteobacteria bacterium]|nr:hypothetical protein [Alphaproteobacteria bacterium]